jgi:hypothetical protein
MPSWQLFKRQPPTQGVILFAASCGSRQKRAIHISNFLWGSDTFLTKSCLCYIYFNKSCYFLNSLPPKGPNNYTYVDLKYLSPLLTRLLTEQRDTWVEFPVRSFNFLRVIPADPRGKWHPAPTVLKCLYFQVMRLQWWSWKLSTLMRIFWYKNPSNFKTLTCNLIFIFLWAEVVNSDQQLSAVISSYKLLPAVLSSYQQLSAVISSYQQL